MFSNKMCQFSCMLLPFCHPLSLLHVFFPFFQTRSILSWYLLALNSGRLWLDSVSFSESLWIALFQGNTLFCRAMESVTNNLSFFWLVVHQLLLSWSYVFLSEGLSFLTLQIFFSFIFGGWISPVGVSGTFKGVKEISPFLQIPLSFSFCSRNMLLSYSLRKLRLTLTNIIFKLGVNISHTLSYFERGPEGCFLKH